MLSDEEKADYRKLLVEVLTTEVRTTVVDAVGAAFNEAERLTSEQIGNVVDGMGALAALVSQLKSMLETMGDRLSVIEEDVRATRTSVATLKRLDRELSDRVSKLES